MTTDKQTEAMKLALKALEWNMWYLSSYGSDTEIATNAITTLREALAEQPAQPRQDEYTPHGWPTWMTNAAPQPAQRKPLTDEEISKSFNAQNEHYALLPRKQAFKAGVRFAEARYGIKEQP